VAGVDIGIGAGIGVGAVADEPALRLSPHPDTERPLKRRSDVTAR
jgi:hypothetical protein